MSETEIDYGGMVDDKPIFNWETFCGEPARTWRHEPVPKWTASEVAKIGLIGLGVAIFAGAVLVLAFVVL